MILYILLLVHMSISVSESKAVDEGWRCFNWPNHQNFTKNSDLYNECNDQCGWVSSCTPCRILNSDLYSCLDTRSNIDNYLYACGDLDKQYSCIIKQNTIIWDQWQEPFVS